jgi:valyl-tRNA synthetase
VTGFDILFFWVARMMMMGLKFMGDVPFRDVYIHALVRDAHGHKMSKSKGNVIDPLVIIEKFGTDSFRFTLTAMAAQGRDISLSEERIEGYRHFVNKLWNASRFALMHGEGLKPGLPAGDLELKDRWILSRLGSVTAQVNDALETYRFNEAANSLYQFVWREFCDWYLEMAKPSLYDRDNAARRSATQQVLFHVLKTITELLHPIMPFVTEEIWQKLPGANGSIVTARFPQPDTTHIQAEVEASMEHLIQFVTAVRTIRAEMNVPPSARPAADLLCHDAGVEEMLQRHTDLICSLAGLARAGVHSAFLRSTTAAAGVVDTGEVFVELEGIIDFDEERKRLEREAAKLKKDIDFISGKLGNAKFVDNAPVDIVQKEREKLAVLEGKQAKLHENIARIASLRTS